jgi:hypothetical protein
MSIHQDHRKVFCKASSTHGVIKKGKWHQLTPCPSGTNHEILGKYLIV